MAGYKREGHTLELRRNRRLRIGGMKAAMTRKCREVRDLMDAGEEAEQIESRMASVRAITDKIYDELMDLSSSVTTMAERENIDDQMATIEDNLVALEEEFTAWRETVLEFSVYEEDAVDTRSKSPASCVGSDKDAALGARNEGLEQRHTVKCPVKEEKDDCVSSKGAYEASGPDTAPSVDVKKENSDCVDLKDTGSVPAADVGSAIGMAPGAAGLIPPSWWMGSPMAACIDVLQLPKSELMNFDGDPLKYHRFMSSFYNSVGRLNVDDNSKLNRLFQYCTGTASKVIECCSVMEPSQGYYQALALLQERFGNNYRISEAWIAKVTAPIPIREAEIQDFADELTNCNETLKAMGCSHEIDTQRSLVNIVERLPRFWQNRWRKEAVTSLEFTGRYPNIDRLVSFVKRLAKETNDPVFGTRSAGTFRKRDGNAKPNVKTSPNDDQARGGARTKVNNFASNAESTQSTDTRTATERSADSADACLLNRAHGVHTLFNCPDFRNMKPRDRLTFTRGNKLCDNCLKPGHFSGGCKLDRRCTVNGCGMKHTKFLHLGERPAAGNVERAPAKNEATCGKVLKSEPEAPNKKEAVPKIHNGMAATGNVTGAGAPVALPVVPVKVRAKGGIGGVVSTYALLDTGSTNTFCQDSLLEELATDGQEALLSLATLGTECEDVKTKVAALEIMDVSEQCSIQLPFVYSTRDLPVPKEAVKAREAFSQWSHLRDLDTPTPVPTGACVKLLIGQDVPQALLPLEVRQGNPGEPYATKTALGWALNSPTKQQGQWSKVSNNFVAMDASLDCQLRKFWELESPDRDDDEAPSIEDKKVLKLWSENITRDVNGHYEMPIPFRDENPQLSTNLELAKRRLNGLRRKFERDKDLYADYKSGMKELLDNGFAERVPDNELVGPEGRTSYIAHFPGKNVNKDRARIVFDCSAPSSDEGLSLNSQVMQGPTKELTTKLLGILLRFREHDVAVMADIRAMFNQVRVVPEHRDALRFLFWPDGDFNQKPVTYRMCVHLFGGIWSPSAASFALRQTAKDNAKEYDEITVQSVEKSTYVDDLCKSVVDTDFAIRLADQLCSLLRRGGFQLTKWLSNDRRVIELLPKEERAPKVKDLDLDVANLPTERVLGVTWDPEADSLGVCGKVMDKPMTRRGVLSVVSSVYDPTGIVSPFVLPAKRIVQELCRRGAGWDEPLSGCEIAEWERWRGDVEKLQLFSVNRCFHPCDFGEVKSSEIHHFCDASEKAYGSVAYVRQISHEGKVHCTIVFAKSKLAPLNRVTIPRLELLAAVEAVKIDQMLQKELDIPLATSTFWTDSTLVLQFINNESKRFKTFVANRVAYIRSHTSPSQWRHIETDQNPGDDVSRGMTADEIVCSKRWVSGPDFLWDVVVERRTISVPALEVNSEIKSSQVFAAGVNTEREDPSGIDKLLGYYSSWNRLRRATAWLLRFKRFLLRKVRKDTDLAPTGSLRVEEIQEAEISIVRYVQRSAYSSELRDLQKGNVKRSSSLYPLEPLLDEAGVMCVGGRLENSPIPAKQKHQMIVPVDSRLGTLLVQHNHERSGHSGREYVMSLLRAKFWLPKARKFVQKLISECPQCRREKAPLMKQRMADLPLDRVIPYEPPFTYIRCDCFGPFLVKRARSDVKRYGCIFTCLVTRAIHIEVLHSMDTDSFIMALRRFISRRGNPVRIRSDNGSNFVGGDNELKKGIDEWNQDAISNFLVQKGIEWVYNPAAASHFGGCWERMIRTVRSTLVSVMNLPAVRKQAIGDEAFLCFMAETESIVNGRPMCPFSDDVRDMEPLTPNHLLLLRSGAGLPPGVFVERDMYRRKWKQAQYLTDLFWERWVKEYLPTLQKRCKWIEPSDNLKVGDVVLVLDESTPRNLWPLARVTEVFTGKDGLVRSASVKTRTTVLSRPIHKLSLLESSVVDVADKET